MRNLFRAGLLVLSAAAPLLAADVPGAARRAIDAANLAWIPAMERQDFAAIVAPYADDGVFVGPTGAVVVGPAGVEKMMRARLAGVRVVGGSLQQDGMRLEGTLIYEWGHATVDVEKSDGTKSSSPGRYLTVWKRTPGGQWKIWRNLSLPATSTRSAGGSGH